MIGSRTFFFTAVDNVITPRVELAVKSMTASSGGDVACVTAVFERGEQVGNFAPYGNVSNGNSTFRQLNSTDETRGFNLEEGSELPVAKATFHQQTHTHHNGLH